MKLLIIGGTRFVGWHLVEAALARGHEVTIFNRGTHVAVARDVETITGDRYHDLAKLRDRRWDVVVDTCGHLPRAVTAAADALRDAVDRYVFISSQSAYADVSKPGVDETAPLAQLTSEQLERANKIDTSGQPSYAELYGGLKALCEQAAEQAMPNRVLTVRPGLIVGPRDYSDRFTYWVVRVARGGEVFAPGRPERPVQLIDARDLAEWLVTMSERREAGVYNANCLPGSMTMQDVLNQCQASSGSDARFTWVPETFLQAEPVMAWSEMPLWLPEENVPRLAGFMFVNVDKAIAAGLQIRPLSDTVRDTLTWANNELTDTSLKAGISAEREQALLRKWQQSS
jgi:2'-hydroxyisoflavone reductase